MDGRHDFAKGQAARIAEGTAFARRQPVDERHAVTRPLQECGAGNADNASADDCRVWVGHGNQVLLGWIFLKKLTQNSSKVEISRVGRRLFRAAMAITPSSTSSTMGRVASCSPS